LYSGELALRRSGQAIGYKRLCETRVILDENMRISEHAKQDLTQNKLFADYNFSELALNLFACL